MIFDLNIPTLHSMNSQLIAIVNKTLVNGDKPAEVQNWRTPAFVYCSEVVVV